MLSLLHSRRAVALFLGVALAVGLSVLVTAQRISARQERPADQTKDEASLLDGFRHVEVASCLMLWNRLPAKRCT